MSNLADFLRARYTEAKARAEAAAEPDSWVELNRQPRPHWYVQHWADPDRTVVVADPESSAYPIAATLEGDAEDSAGARVRFIVANDPAYVLADLDAKLALLDDWLGERHDVNDGDCWYTCAAATEERDGGETCDETRRGKPCDCGVDVRIQRHLRLLAGPFTDRPDFKAEWRA